jgi:hypothetical protein
MDSYTSIIPGCRPSSARRAAGQDQHDGGHPRRDPHLAASGEEASAAALVWVRGRSVGYGRA